MSHFNARGIAFVASQWTLIAIAILVVCVRLYSRIFLTRSVGSDDFAISVALFLEFAGCSLDTVAFKNGLAQHESALSEDQLTKFEKSSEYLSYTIVYLVYFFLRTSIMLFVLRLLPQHKKLQRRFIYAVLCINLAITILATVTYGISCIPFQANWEQEPNAQCLSKEVLVVVNLINASLACVCDIVTAAVPQILLWGVQMKTRTKRVLNVFFGVGLVTACLSIARAATISRKTLSEDTPWNMVASYYISSLESKLGLLAACSPAMRQFFAYAGRTHSILPTPSRQYSNEDFVKTRLRVHWRDVLWYRRASMVGDRVFEARSDLYNSSSASSNDLRKVPGSGSATKSVLDMWEARIKKMMRPSRASTASAAWPLHRSSSNESTTRIISPPSANTRSYKQSNLTRQKPFCSTSVPCGGWPAGNGPPVQPTSQPPEHVPNAYHTEECSRPSEDIELADNLARGHVDRQR